MDHLIFICLNILEMRMTVNVRADLQILYWGFLFKYILKISQEILSLYKNSCVFSTINTQFLCIFQIADNELVVKTFSKLLNVLLQLII